MGHPVPSTAPAPAPATPNGDATQDSPKVSSSVNELISGVAKEAAEKATDSTEKPSKKDKSKPTRMIYSDETVSPEEKMAQLPRYAFAREQFHQETALGELPGAVVVGTIREQDTVVDPAH